jgi:hypothetical protein
MSSSTDRPSPGGHAPDDPAADAFEQRARERLLDSAEGLDGATRSRLTQARHAALAELEARPHGFRVPGFWLPVSALGCAAVLALAVWLRASGVAHESAPTTAQSVAQPQSGAPESPSIEDLVLLVANDDAELYAEDPEFYEWAGSADAAGGGRG